MPTFLLDKKIGNIRAKRTFCSTCINYKKTTTSKGTEMEVCASKKSYYTTFRKNKVLDKDCLEFIKNDGVKISKKFTKEEIKAILDSRIEKTKDENIRYLLSITDYSKKYITILYGSWKNEFIKFKGDKK